ncbi:MAG: sulfotransferase domain-containing protein [Gordonia sp. (in: high G+C Gram-positive bacteria)]|uniref:sulfotransferase domain-containing protein n=1 Tax=Gordonia TaxID=2053 RepID=UPI0032643442
MTDFDADLFATSYEWTTELFLLRFNDRPIRERLARRAQLFGTWLTRPLPHYWDTPPPWLYLARKATASNRSIPDFLCLGAIKSGTSDLATNLIAHPSIGTPLCKELPHHDPEKWRLYYPTDDEMDLIRESTGTARNGYFNPHLMDHDFPEAVAAARPDMQIVIMLRDPVDRMYSHFKFDYMFGGAKALTNPVFDDYASYVDYALGKYPYPSNFYTPQAPLHSGIYAPRLKRWSEFFPPEQILLLQAEDYFTDPATVLARIHDFLDLPPVDYQRLPVVNESPVAAPAQDEQSRQKLIDFYRPHNAELEELTGLSFGWN